MVLRSLLSRSTLINHKTHCQPMIKDSSFIQSRQLHIEPGSREKALLEEDPALKKFKSHKRKVWRLKRLGDVLTIVVVAGCCYEIYVKAVMGKAAREVADIDAA